MFKYFVDSKGGGRGAKKGDLDKKWMPFPWHTDCQQSTCTPLPKWAPRSLHLPHGYGPWPILSLDVPSLVSPLLPLLLPSKWFSTGAELLPMVYHGHFCGWGFVVTMMGGNTLELRFPTPCAMETFSISHMTFKRSSGHLCRWNPASKTCI